VIVEGIGIYIRRLSAKLDGGPVVAAKRAADHGVRMVAIMGAWQEPRGGRVATGAPNAEIADRYVEQFAKRGIKVWLWGYPWGGEHDAFARAMQGTANPQGIEGWLLDPELGFKWAAGRQPKVPLGSVDAMRQGEAIPGTPSGTQAIRRAQATALVDASIAALGTRALATTSYGRAKFHPNFPWNQFVRAARGTDMPGVRSGPVIGSPQLYTSTPDQVDAGIREWREHGFEWIVPSVGSFGPRSGAKLHEHLSTFVDGTEDVRGFWVWSWQQTDSQEWRVLARWASWFERGVVAASKRVG
jgi:hypothetical protein